MGPGLERLTLLAYRGNGNAAGEANGCEKLDERSVWQVEERKIEEDVEPSDQLHGSKRHEGPRPLHLRQAKGCDCDIECLQGRYHDLWQDCPYQKGLTAQARSVKLEDLATRASKQPHQGQQKQR